MWQHVALTVKLWVQCREVYKWTVIQTGLRAKVNACHWPCNVDCQRGIIAGGTINTPSNYNTLSMAMPQTKKAAPHELSIAWLKSSTHLKHNHNMDAAIHSNLFTCSSMHSLTCRLRRSAVPLQTKRRQTQISISCSNFSLRRRLSDLPAFVLDRSRL